MPSAFAIFAGVEVHQPADRRRGGERTGGAGRMEAARLVRMLGGVADPQRGLGAGDKGGEELAAGEPAILRDGQRRA